MHLFSRTLALAAGSALALPAFSQVAYYQPFAVPGTSAANPFKSWDQISIDPALQLGVVASRSSKAVTLFNAFTGEPVGSTPPVFTGVGKDVNNSGPDGAIIAGTQIWATDYPSTVRVFDLAQSLTAPPQVGVIDTGGKSRTDSIDYDPANGVIIAANSDTSPDVPFLTLIDAKTQKIVKRVNFDGSNGAPDASIDGIGGVLYDKAIDKFLATATSLGQDDAKGAVAVLNTITGAVERVIPGLDGCQPSTLAAGPGNNVIVGCDPGFPAPDAKVFSPKTYIVDAAAGTVVAAITDVGGADFVAYNSGDNRYYTASRDFFISATQAAPSPVLGIIDAATNKWIANIPTAIGTHAVAVNPFNNGIFVPIAPGSPFCGGLAGCVATAVSVPLAK